MKKIVELEDLGQKGLRADVLGVFYMNRWSDTESQEYETLTQAAHQQATLGNDSKELHFMLLHHNLGYPRWNRNASHTIRLQTLYEKGTENLSSWVIRNNPMSQG